MKIYVKWFVVVLFISSLTSFIRVGDSAHGLDVGESAPDFRFTAADGSPETSLSSLSERYVILSFWATSDAASRLQNAALNSALDHVGQDVAFVSVSLDEYQSVFQESVRQDGVDRHYCFNEAMGEKSKLYDMYKLDEGLTNYLLDENGMIIAKDISASELSAYLK